MPWVRAYNERARVTEGWEVVEDERKASIALHHAHSTMRRKAAREPKQ